MKAKKVYEYKIGDWVVVIGKTIMVYEGTPIPRPAGVSVPVTEDPFGFDSEFPPQRYHRKPLLCKHKPILAQIVGATRRPVGEFKSYGSSFDPGGDFGNYLKVTGTVMLYQCRARLFGKPIEAQPEHIRQATAEEIATQSVI